MSIKRNKVYRPFYESDKKYNILRGGSGSGKSYAVAEDVIIRTLDTRLSRTIIARKVAATLRQSVFRLLQNRIYEMGLGDHFTINKSEMTFTAGKNEIILVGLDDVNKLKSIFDPTDAWIEEADQVSQSDFEEIDRRIRSVTGRKPKITLSFNPTSVYSWLKRYFYDSKFLGDDVYELTTTYRDNAFLDPAYAQTIERLQETNPSAYRVYGLGEWGIVEGVVFDKWDTKAIDERARLIGYGLDFGYALDPAALIKVYVRGTELWLDEIIYQHGLTNQDLGVLMRSAGVGRTDEIIADSAEPKSIEELYRQGFNVHPAVKGPDSVNAGIAKLQEYTIHCTPRSKNVAKELASYSWAKDKDGNIISKPVDLYNHAIDAVRYRVTMQDRKVKAGPSGLGI